MTQHDHILEIEHAVKRFKSPGGGTFNALDNVNLKVKANEFVTLLGPSGCGKTTLLRCIAGLERLDSGRIVMDGKDITHTKPYHRQLNTVFQSYALFPHLNVARNVGFSLEIKKVPKAEIRERVEKVLDVVGLKGSAERNVKQLSGGQQQRVALARSIIAEPKVLLLDEPLSALDKKLRLRMQQELKMLQTELGISFIFVTHDQEEALTMSDRVVVLGQGSIKQIDTPNRLYSTPKNYFSATFVGEGNFFDATVTASAASAQTVTVRTDDGQELQIPVTQSNVDDLTPSQQVSLFVRPEYFVRHAAGDPTENRFVVNGVVDQLFFTGASIKVRLRAAQDNVLLIQEFVTGESEPLSYREGQEISYSAPIEKMILLERE